MSENIAAIKRLPAPKAKTTIPLNRWEITIAEILRTNAPISFVESDGMMWLDLVEDFVHMLGAEKPRFDSDAFYNHCFNGQDPELAKMDGL